MLCSVLPELLSISPPFFCHYYVNPLFDTVIVRTCLCYSTATLPYGAFCRSSADISRDIAFQYIRSSSDWLLVSNGANQKQRPFLHRATLRHTLGPDRGSTTETASSPSHGRLSLGPFLGWPAASGTLGGLDLACDIDECNQRRLHCSAVAGRLRGGRADCHLSFDPPPFVALWRFLFMHELLHSRERR